MHKKEKSYENQFTWPICKKLLFLVLEDNVSDVFVCELVWERLFYTRETTLNKEDIINKSLIALNIGRPDQIIQNASKYNKDVMPYFSLILIRFD